MSVHPLAEIALQGEVEMVERAQQGDSDAFGSLLEPWRKPLFEYIYRMVTLRQVAEDLLQDVLVRVLEGIRMYRGEARFKSWPFGIATHVRLDYLRAKKRWRAEAQLIGKREGTADPQQVEGLRSMMRQPGVSFRDSRTYRVLLFLHRADLVAGRAGRVDAETCSGIYEYGGCCDSGGFGACLLAAALGGASEDDWRFRWPLRADQ